MASLGISSPYRRIGLLYTKHRDYFGRDDHDVLVIQSPTIKLNPTISQATIARARTDDPLAALAEWDAEFRSDLAQFLDDASIEAAIDYGRPLEIPPREGLAYHAFAAMSAGRHDASVVCILHTEGEGENRRFIADVIRWPWRPAQPGGNCQRICCPRPAVSLP